MNKILLSLALVLLAGCASMTPAERAAKAQQVRTALDNRHYKVDVQMMFPRRGPSKNVTSDWSLEVKGDTLVSYLPYIGRAFNIPPGGGVGLNFTTTITNYQERMKKEGLRQIVIGATNDEDSYTYTLEVFDNGNVTIDVQPRERESIGFGGILCDEH